MYIITSDIIMCMICLRYHDFANMLMEAIRPSVTQRFAALHNENPVITFHLSKTITLSSCNCLLVTATKLKANNRQYDQHFFTCTVYVHYLKKSRTFWICLIYRVRHKSVNTRVRHKSVNTPLSHERLVVRTWLAVYALPPTTIYCEPGAYDKPFVG